MGKCEEGTPRWLLPRRSSPPRARYLVDPHQVFLQVLPGGYCLEDCLPLVQGTPRWLLPRRSSTPRARYLVDPHQVFLQVLPGGYCLEDRLPRARYLVDPHQVFLQVLPGGYCLEDRLPLVQGILWTLTSCSCRWLLPRRSSPPRARYIVDPHQVFLQVFPGGYCLEDRLPRARYLVDPHQVFLQVFPGGYCLEDRLPLVQGILWTLTRCFCRYSQVAIA
uniref:Uncharacterized protein n=1 Tax=Timema bartmani TaxID=61472 RepID=A0A7R9F8M0_9NEOP|nr:unnamed protein product [Timema bartmani]